MHQPLKIYKIFGFNVHIPKNIKDSSALVTEQNPKPGVQLIKNKNSNNVYLYTEDYNIKDSVTVPDFTGMSAAQVLNSANSKGLNVSFNGSGSVISQNTATNTEVEVGTIIIVNLSNDTSGGY